MSASRDDEFGFAPDYDSPVPYMQRTRDYYTAIGYTTPYRWAHYTEAPFQPLKKPLSQSRVTIITTAAPYDPTKGDQGPGAAYNGGAKFYQVYDGDTVEAARSSHLAYRLRPQAHHGDRQRHLVSAAAALEGICRRPHRRGEPALLRRADQPQPSRHARHRRAGNPGALPRRQGRCRRAGAELPGLPPDHGAGGAASRGQRHSDRGHGLRQGHHRACRRAALPVLGLPARQFRRQAARRRLAGADAGAGAEAAGDRERPQTTMQSPLRWSEDASWKLDYNNVAQLSPEELARRRAEFDKQKEIARGNRAA